MMCATHLAPSARTPFAYVAIAVSLFALACTPESAPDPASDPGEAATPNLVLLISIDTLRPDHLGLYGYEYFTSPILNAVALDGESILRAGLADRTGLPGVAGPHRRYVWREAA
jgi:glucan phosphoethanolaminetransferase (alkaline phosphatase superfamily)